MKKTVKIIAIFLAVIIVSLTATVSLLSDKIQQVLLKEINEQLAVEGSFKRLDVTFWSTFPKVGLRMEQLTLKESSPLLEKYLLEADVFYLQFNLIDAVFGKYELEKVSGNDIILRLAVKNETENFVLLKEGTTDSIGDNKIKIDLKSIVFDKAIIEYHDLDDTTSIIYDFKRIKSKGSIETEEVNFNLDANGLGKTFVLYNKAFPITKPTSLKAKITYNMEKDEFVIKKGTLEIDKTELDLNGFFVFAEKDSMDLNFESKTSKISQVAGLLPYDLGNSLSSFKTEGDFIIKSRINGKFGGDDIPNIEANVKISKGKIYPKIGTHPLENINFKANIFYGKNNEYLQIPVFSFKLGEHTFGGNFDANGFSDPYIEGDFKGVINLKYLNNLIDFDSIQLSGLLDCDVKIKGKISELSTGKEFQENGLKGKMIWKDIEFNSTMEDLRDFKITECNAILNMDGNNIKANNITGKLNNDNFTLSASIDKLLPFIFGDSKVEVYADVMADKIMLPAFFSESNNNTQETANPSDMYEIFPEKMLLDLKFNVKEINIGQISAYNLQGVLFANDNLIKVDRFSGTLVEGNFSGLISIKKWRENNVFCSFDLDGIGLDINKLFMSFDNFGQEEITYKNLEGKLDANTQMILIFNRDGSIDKENMYAFVDLTIKDGVLKDYETLESLANYVELSELKNIRFAKLTNTIEIKDGEFNFPYMDVGNSALNLKIKGRQNFDFYMDYTFRVKLSEALASKYKIKKKREFDEYEELGDKGIAIYIRMTGYPDDLKFKVEKVGGKPSLTQEGVKEGVKTAREEFKETIQQEFSIDKRIEVKKQEAENEQVDWDE